MRMPLIIVDVLKEYQVPVSIVSTVLILWALNSFVFPHIKGIPSLWTKGKDLQIQDLTSRLNKLEEQCEQIKSKLQATETRENKLIGFLKGLNLQLQTVGIEIEDSINDLISE